MPTVTSDLVKQYVELLSKIYGEHLKTVILYGSYARGDYTENSDIDIMVLLDLSDIDIKKYRHELSGMTYDFNMDYDLDIKPIVKNKEHFNKWVDVYPFYTNIQVIAKLEKLVRNLKVKQGRIRAENEFWNEKWITEDFKRTISYWLYESGNSYAMSGFKLRMYS